MRFLSIHSTGKFLAIAMASTLAACGGGGGDDSTPPQTPAPAPVASPKAEGAYTGSLTGSSSTGFQLLMLENDEYWALYGATSGSNFLVAGFIQGNGASANGSFTSTNAKDFGVSPVQSGSISASYVANTSLQGTIASGGRTVTLNGTSIPTATYNYNTAASLGDVAGSWTLTALNGALTRLTISSTGAVTGSSGSCTFTGSLVPRPSGKNVFNVALTFGAAPCASPGLAATGIALSYPVTGTSLRQLMVAGTDSGRNVGTALFGTR